MIQSLFNIDLPLIQAPMAGVQNVELAASVCEAGGLGSLPCAMLSPAQLVEQLDLLTQKTLVVHLKCTLYFLDKKSMKT